MLGCRLLHSHETGPEALSGASSVMAVDPSSLTYFDAAFTLLPQSEAEFRFGPAWVCRVCEEFPKTYSALGFFRDALSCGRKPVEHRLFATKMAKQSAFIPGIDTALVSFAALVLAEQQRTVLAARDPGSKALSRPLLIPIETKAGEVAIALPAYGDHRCGSDYLGAIHSTEVLFTVACDDTIGPYGDVQQVYTTTVTVPEDVMSACIEESAGLLSGWYSAVVAAGRTKFMLQTGVSPYRAFYWRDPDTADRPIVMMSPFGSPALVVEQGYSRRVAWLSFKLGVPTNSFLLQTNADGSRSIALGGHHPENVEEPSACLGDVDPMTGSSQRQTYTASGAHATDLTNVNARAPLRLGKASNGLATPNDVWHFAEPNSSEGPASKAAFAHYLCPIIMWLLDCGPGYMHLSQAHGPWYKFVFDGKHCVGFKHLREPTRLLESVAYTIAANASSAVWDTRGREDMERKLYWLFTEVDADALGYTGPERTPVHGIDGKLFRAQGFFGPWLKAYMHTMHDLHPAMPLPTMLRTIMAWNLAPPARRTNAVVGLQEMGPDPGVRHERQNEHFDHRYRPGTKLAL